MDDYRSSALLPSREATFPIEGKRIWVAGHQGMLGRALTRRLASAGAEMIGLGRAELDLTRQDDVLDWVAQTKPDAAIIAAAKVGGILANATYPADFLRDNLQIGLNCIEAAHRCGISKLLMVASAAVYPRDAAQPVHETALMTGPVEMAHEPYAVAKIAAIKLCQAFARQHGARFISANPSNLYGPGDYFDLARSHVVPALIRKAHDAKVSGAPEMVVWGTGKTRREFLFADDCADALLHVLAHYESPEPINIGTGVDHTIAELLATIVSAVGFEGRIVHDTSKPDGPARRLLDSSRLADLGWRASVNLENGIRDTYHWYREALRDGLIRT